MAQFSYAQYQTVVAQAQSSGEGTKVGYFKLSNDGDIAIARLNIGSTEDLDFASVHTINTGGRWTKVSCLNPLGSYGGECALCSAHASNPKGAISKAAKKVYIQMMVSYRDPNSVTGYTAPAPVIWERPAGFSRELANKLMIAGDLRNTLVLITRNGKAGDMQTTYSMDILPETHPVFKPEMIPVNFDAFNGFNIARHSYWEKTPEEINTYLATGQFPERVNVAAQTTPAATSQTFATPTPTPSVPTYNSNVTQTAAQPVAYNQATMQTVATTPVPDVAATTGAPVRNFTGFSF